MGGSEDGTEDRSWESAGELVDGELMAFRMLMVADIFGSDAPTYVH